MNTRKKILYIGIILLISGSFAALMSFQPSAVLKYVFVGGFLSAGTLAVLTGFGGKRSFAQRNYYSWVGIVSIGLSIALFIWATSAIAFIHLVGGFLLAFGLIEFRFALEYYDRDMPWKVVSLKLTRSAIMAVGAAWVLIMAGFDMGIALLSPGVLFVLVGLTYIRMSRLVDKSALS